MKIIYIIIGLLSLVIGFIGTILPMLPTFPFLILSAICFAKSSEKLNTWFINTNLYKNNLQTYVERKAMKMSVKIKIIIMITIFIGLSFMIIPDSVIIRLILVTVWLVHFVYFTFGVKTLK